MQVDGPQVFLDIDRDKARSLGVTTAALETALTTAYAARQVTNLYGATDTYKVVVEVQPEFQLRPDLLNKLYVKTSQVDSSGNPVLVPLNGLVKMTEGVGPLVVNHTGQLTSVTISFNTAGKYSLGEAVTAVTQLANKELPSNISFTFEGQATAFKESLSSVPFLLFMISTSCTESTNPRPPGPQITPVKSSPTRDGTLKRWQTRMTRTANPKIAVTSGSSGISMVSRRSPRAWRNPS